MTMTTQDIDVLCVGLCVLDIIHVCDRYPGEDSDIRSKNGRWQRGGNASNVCTVLNQLGATCEFVGSLANTKMFQFVIDDAVDRGIRMNHCTLHDNYQAPVSSVILNTATGSRTIFFNGANLPIFTFDDFRKIDLSQYKWIHFEARNRDETVQMIDAVVRWNANNHNRRITISLELEKPRRENLILAQHVDVIFVGKDFGRPFGWTKESTVREIAKCAKNTARIICAWGEDGAVALNVANGEFHTAAACPPAQIVDTLGAGDTFVAATLYSLQRHNNLEKSIVFGCRVAGAKIGFDGYDQIGDFLKHA